jgi:hypothetical protein
MAIISLVSGILAVICTILFCLPCTLILAYVFSLAAAVLGFISLGQINNSEGALTGRGLAIGGLIAGLASLVGAIVLSIFGVVLSLPTFLVPILEGLNY